MRVRLLVVLLFALSSVVFGQEFRRAEVFGGYSYMNVDTEGLGDRVSAHGWAASLTVNVNRWLGVTADFSGHYKPNCGSVSGVTCRDYSYLFGPKLSYRIADSKAVLFAYGLVGGHNLGAGYAGLTASQDSLAFAVGGGFDYAMTRNISIRVAQVDYLFTRHLQTLGGTHQNNIRVAAGVVFAFGGASAVQADSASTTSTNARPMPSGNIEIPELELTGTNTDRGFLVTTVAQGGPAGVTSNDLVYSVNGIVVKTGAEIKAALGDGATAKVVFMLGRMTPVEREIRLKRP
jgi:opacity protein-like surface antigen